MPILLFLAVDMKIRYAEFTRSAADPSEYPGDGLPEVVVVGRSNVGKSSLINALTGRKGLARTSSAPGKTRTINFYRLNRALYLVDLPGFGYAKASIAERRRWKSMIERYFEDRKTIEGVVVVLDPRRDPGTIETSLYRWLERLKIPVITVPTKCDKLSINRLSSRVAAIKKLVPIEELVLFSAATGEGKALLGRKIFELIKTNTSCKRPQKGIAAKRSLH
jgi:GTP-binding protein